MKYGLIGEKLGHSYSKLIQERLIDNYEYELHPLSKDALATFMKEKNFTGINVTIPYKQEVIPYLDEIDDKAKSIGAVNTIVNENGKLKGYNTDYHGFKYMLTFHHIQIKDKKVMVLGNGGASKAIQAVIQDLDCKELILVSRTSNEGSVSYEDAIKLYQDANIIINTTPLGMYPNNDTQAIDLKPFPKLEACLDVVYNPLQTKLILQAKALGIKAIGGLEMLVAQAKYALEYFKNIIIEESEIDRIYREILLETSNLVFIGMPGSGKTTIAHKCAEYLDRTCIDLDQEIVKEIGMSIREYFEIHEEEKFREVESEICKKYASLGGLVISCGGGIVKRETNISALHQNGVLLQLHRNQKYLETDASRPLSSNQKDLEKLIRERTPLYENARDIYLENDASIAKVSKKAKEAYINKILNYK